MENKLNKTEQEFREVAQNYTPKIATDDIWNAIESEIPKKEKRRYFGLYWFLFGATTACMLLLGIVIPLINNEDILIQNESKESQEVQYSEVFEDTESISNTNNYTTNGGVTNEMTSSINIPKNLKPESIIKDLQTENGYLNNNKYSIRLKNTNSNTYTKDHSPILINHENEDASKASKSNAFLGPLVKMESMHSRLEKPQSNSPNDAFLDQKSMPIYVSEIGLQELDFFKIDEVQISLVVKPYDTKISPITPAKWKWEYGFHSGVNVSDDRYSSSSGESIDLDERFGLEKGLVGLSIDLKTGQRSAKGYAWHAGLGYSLLANQFERNERIVNTRMEEGIKEINIDGTGMPILTVDNILISEINDIDIKWNRMCQTYSISLDGSIPLAQYKKWIFDLEGGIRYDFYSKTEGYYFEPDHLSITKFENDESNPFKTYGTSQIQLGIPISYSLTKVELVLTPFYRYGINSITNKNSFYNQKSSQSGLQLGIVYRPQ